MSFWKPGEPHPSISTNKHVDITEAATNPNKQTTLKLSKSVLSMKFMKSRQQPIDASPSGSTTTLIGRLPTSQIISPVNTIVVTTPAANVEIIEDYTDAVSMLPG